jgi:chorismate mutase
VTRRRVTPQRAGEETALEALRGELERLDRELLALIGERVRMARRIGVVKQAAGRPVLDPAREAAVVRRMAALAREAGLPAEEVREIFWRLIGLCRRAQVET